MIRKAVLFAVAIGLAGVAAAGAQTTTQINARYSHDYDRCLKTGDAAKGITSAMMDCIGLEIDRQDARLNQTYKRVMVRLNSAGKTGLRTVQRGWIKQRDSRCSRESDANGGGTLSGIIYASCILHETIKRTIWLERYKD
jgi:uncharacterized protein YecT (DUF1311 family)